MDSADALKGLIARQAVEIEKLRKDAERYRWLRAYLPSNDLQYDDALVAAKTGEELDAAIDAAIQKELT